MGKVKRRTDEGLLAECPLCGSLDIGGATDTVNCYGCGLQITKPRPLQNAMDAWNMRGGKSLKDYNDGWTRIVKGEEPEGKVLVAYDEPCWGSYSKETECAFFDDGEWMFWLSSRTISTHKNGVTHWQSLPEHDDDYNEEDKADEE